MSSHYLDILYDTLLSSRHSNASMNRIGVTELIGSLKAAVLAKKVETEIKQRDIFRMLKGTALHDKLALILTRKLIKNPDYAESIIQNIVNDEYLTQEEAFKLSMHEDYLIEYPLSLPVQDIWVRGIMDLVSFEHKKIVDWKTASTYKYVFGDYETYEKQLNVYRYLAAQTEERFDRIEKLELCFWWDGWSQSKTKDSDYPEENVTTVDIDVMSNEDVQDYLNKRITLYKQLAELSVQELSALDICTREEKMQRDDSYAVKKPGRKTALAVFKTQEEATAYNVANKGTFVEKRTGVANCVNYCKAVKYCKFAQESIYNMDDSSILQMGTL